MTIRGRKTWRDLVVPYPLNWADGVPSFTDLDPVLVHECLARSLCGICGYVLSPRRPFWIGGERHIADSSEWIGDLPMHHRCALYAVQKCPYLRGESRSTDELPLWLIAGTGVEVFKLTSRPAEVRWTRRIRDIEEEGDRDAGS